MKITVRRFAHNDEATLSRVYLDDEEFCFGLEDQPQEKKVMHETRIPAGTYDIKLRNEGGMTKRYAERYDFHEGMLHVQDVPNFTYIYIHVGNSDKNTSGCLLVGGTRNEDNFTIGNSRAAYSDLYRAVVEAAKDEDLQIEYIDEDMDDG
tara:strand:+ start:1007 stop:1456 length:450 start_codon:yes stop_codon:yes gene_type:complete